MNDPYRKTIPRREDGTSDIYDVIFAYKVSNPAVEHAIKKLLCPGVRGAKGVLQDLDEARKSIVRAIELEQGALVAKPEPSNPARHQKERVQGARGTVFKCKKCGDQFTSLEGCPSCARHEKTEPTYEELEDEAAEFTAGIIGDLLGGKAKEKPAPCPVCKGGMGPEDDGSCPACGAPGVSCT